VVGLQAQPALDRQAAAGDHRQIDAPARIKIDAYPGEVFEARVSYVGGAATSQFALLPNPNPSGNFTKVTQRIPVRLEIVQQQGRLRPGMMVEATIDVVD
jgi:membrane fusion protein (multidrug efflux system)